MCPGLPQYAINMKEAIRTKGAFFTQPLEHRLSYSTQTQTFSQAGFT